MPGSAPEQAPEVPDIEPVVGQDPIQPVRLPTIGNSFRIVAYNLWSNPCTITLEFVSGDIRQPSVRLVVAILSSTASPQHDQ
jgi:hypothetical protein